MAMLMHCPDVPVQQLSVAIANDRSNEAKQH